MNKQLVVCDSCGKELEFKPQNPDQARDWVAVRIGGAGTAQIDFCCIACAIQFFELEKKKK